MNKNLLKKHITNFLENLKKKPEKQINDFKERKNRINYYQSISKDKILKMSKEDLLEYISKLWAMLIWGNKQYYVDKLIADNGFDNLKVELANLLWSNETIEIRWDKARIALKGIGPALMSELLCYVYPNKYILWNRRAYVGLEYLGVKNLPKYSYQLDGKKYRG